MTDPASTRLLLVAFESVDWDLLAPLIGSGQLPNLAALIENGVIADLASLQPAVPALLWTSLATGVRGDRHGVLDHFQIDPLSGELLPVTPAQRKVKTLWQLLADAGLICHAINWTNSPLPRTVRPRCEGDGDRSRGVALPAGRATDPVCDSPHAVPCVASCESCRCPRLPNWS